MSKLNKARIRRNIKIKGQQWQVIFTWNLRDDKLQKVDGLCDPSKKTIFIDRMVPNEDKWFVFFHELIHAIIYELHLNEDGGIDGITGEILAEGITVALHDIFQMRWLGARKRQKTGLRAIKHG